MENISEFIDETEEIEELIPSRKIQFWSILPFEIVSLICNIYVLLHLLLRKNLRNAMHNHVIIVLMFLAFIANVIDVPLYLDAYLHNGRSSFSSSIIICYIWLIIDYGVYGTVTVLFAYASIERHVLIFHSNQLLNTKVKRLIFHYIPLVTICTYITGFYIGVIFFPPCENQFDYSYEACGMSPCYESISWLNIWDYLVNGVICILIETIGSITLLIRVIWKRYRAHRRVDWKKHRKMAIQLLSISALSLSITLPQAVIYSVQVFPGMEDFAYVIGSYFFYLTTYVLLLLPLVSMSSLPELWPKILCCKIQRRSRVFPMRKLTNRPQTLHMYTQATRN